MSGQTKITLELEILKTFFATNWVAMKRDFAHSMKRILMVSGHCKVEWEGDLG